MLRDIPIEVRYDSGQNIATDFFVPCLNESVSYDRAAGYFSSTLYAVIGVPLAAFGKRGGRMRLVCSPQLSQEDIEAMSAGYRDQRLADALLRELEAMTAEPVAEAATTLLATLVALGILEIRIAFRPAEAGIYHDKVGLFLDATGGRVTFTGSANETWNAWSGQGNFEGFHAFTSWSDASHVAGDVEYFERVWNNNQDGLVVEPFPEVARERLTAKADPEGLEPAQTELDRLRVSRAPQPPLRRHQQTAMDNWVAAGHRGLFEHATGSGKTITALSCIRIAVDEKRPTLIVVPSVLLLRQWRDEVRRFCGEEVSLLLTGDQYGQWKAGSTLRDHLLVSPDKPPVVVATIDTASSEPFVARMQDVPALLLVVDEVHRVGSPMRRRLLEIDADWRLGLSATWEREGDPLGTEVIRQYFGGVIDPVYTIADAVHDGHLCKYSYFIHTVSLDDDERQEWEALRQRIGAAMGQAKGEITENVQQLLIQRARIVKSAREKVGVAVGVLEQHYEPDKKQAWLVYCDNRHQVEAVRLAAARRGIRTQEYHTQMAGDGGVALAEFSREGGVLVAINCLDEGVDIPRISHALVLASSTTRRQFIQRRGRVLRQHDTKHRAAIHDLLVDTSGFKDPENISFMRTELARALEFVRSAVDSSATEVEIRRLAQQALVDIDAEGAGSWVEDETEDELEEE
jgi:superfamily II DNA or RNA helicase